MEYSIAIPSYKRSKTIQDKTLKVFEQHKIDPAKVTVFVADDQEFEIYSDAHKIVTGKLYSIIEISPNY